MAYAISVRVELNSTTASAMTVAKIKWFQAEEIQYWILLLETVLRYLIFIAFSTFPVKKMIVKKKKSSLEIPFSFRMRRVSALCHQYASQLSSGTRVTIRIPCVSQQEVISDELCVSTCVVPFLYVAQTIRKWNAQSLLLNGCRHVRSLYATTRTPGRHATQKDHVCEKALNAKKLNTALTSNSLFYSLTAKWFWFCDVTERYHVFIFFNFEFDKGQIITYGTLKPETP